MTVRPAALLACVLTGVFVGCAVSGDGVSRTTLTDTTLTDTTLLPGPDTGAAPDVAPGVLEEFFDQVVVRVLDADGVERELCLWVADSDVERARGLMQVTDLEGADGMVFVYDRPTNSAFWMKDTLLPLSIAYFDVDGMYVGAQDMQPCAPGTDCRVYPPPGEFVLAVEVPQGGLADLSLVAGSSIELGEPCVAASN
jgi:uncharacterized membrane protein (UPF0127 family)